jgi:Domain of unknown function (DUF4406)
MIPKYINGKRTVIYVSGPMSGKVDHNVPAFQAATKILRKAGYKVIDPSENDAGSRDKPWAFYMNLDLVSVAKSNALVLLPGWEWSKGANIEIANAERLEKNIFEIVNGNDYTKIGVLLLEPITPIVTVKARRSFKGKVKKWLKKVLLKMGIRLASSMILVKPDFI